MEVRADPLVAESISLPLEAGVIRRRLGLLLL